MDANTRLGHYTILRPLGKGGMGEVYLAEDIKLKREVAIKVLPALVRDDADRLRRFRREAEAAAKLKHPNIATIYALEDVDDLLLFVSHMDDDEVRKRLQELLPEYQPTEYSSRSQASADVFRMDSVEPLTMKTQSDD